jgi:ankyrin repeat protein
MLLGFEGGKKVHNEANDCEPLVITAAKYDSEEVTAWLLESGESTDIKDKDGLTPLHHAAISDSRNVALLLMKKGADVNSKNKNLLSPLHYAVLKRRTDIAILLSAWKADLHAETKENLTVLHLVSMADELIFPKNIVSQTRYPGANRQ